MKKYPAFLFIICFVISCVSPTKQLPILNPKNEPIHYSSDGISISLRPLLPQETQAIFARNLHADYIEPYSVCIENTTDEPLLVNTLNLWSRLNVEEVNDYVKTPEMKAIGYGSAASVLMPLLLHNSFNSGIPVHKSNLQTPQAYYWSLISGGIISGAATAVLIINNKTVLKELEKYSAQGHVFEPKKTDCAAMYIDKTMSAYSLQLLPSVSAASDISVSYIEVQLIKSGKKIYFPFQYK